MSRIITGEVRIEVMRVDLRTMIDSAIAWAQPTADARCIRIERSFDPAAGPNCGVAARLGRVTEGA